MGWRDEWAGRGGVERAPWHTRKTETDRQTKIEIEGEKKVHFQDILGVQFSAEVIIQKIEHMSPFTTVQIPVSRCMYRFCWICTAYNSWGPKYLFQWIGILRKVKNRSRFEGLKHATWSKSNFWSRKVLWRLNFHSEVNQAELYKSILHLQSITVFWSGFSNTYFWGNGVQITIFTSSCFSAKKTSYPH